MSFCEVQVYDFSCSLSFYCYSFHVLQSSNSSIVFPVSYIPLSSFLNSLRHCSCVDAVFNCMIVSYSCRFCNNSFNSQRIPKPTRAQIPKPEHPWASVKKRTQQHLHLYRTVNTMARLIDLQLFSKCVDNDISCCRPKNVHTGKTQID